MLCLWCGIHTIFLRCDTEGATRPEHFSRWKCVSLFGYFSLLISSAGSNSPQAPGQDLGVYIPELQFARCMSNRYKLEAFPRCVSCTRRWAGDTCRFQGIRYFMRNADGKLLGISFNESHSVSPTPTMEFPKRWNRKVEMEHVRPSKVFMSFRLILPPERFLSCFSCLSRKHFCQF